MYRTPIDHWNFWPGIFTDYDDLSEAVNAMNKAIEQDNDEYEMCERDRVLGGVVRYLAENIPDEQKYQVLRILEVYCGKPVEQARLQYEQDEPVEQEEVKSGYIAGEDLRRGFVYQGPDGLLYQAKPGKAIEEE